jgi:L-ascorbate metabolism protein UlaG (beta-lactamase superfamily)
MSILVIVSAIIALVIIASLFFYFAPQIGKAAEGNRLARIEGSRNYKLGKFHNLLQTPMDMSFKDMSSTMWEMIKGDSARQPVDTITTKEFDKEAFINASDSEAVLSWFGHSSLLIKMEGQVLLVDPVFAERASMFTFMGPKRYEYSSQMRVDMLPEVDAVLISHDHYDHLDYSTFQQLRDKVKHFYVPLGVGAHLAHWGIEESRIIEFDWWEERQLTGNLELVFTPSRHFSGRGLGNRFSTLWGSWVIKGRSQRLFFGGDSGYFPGFKDIGIKYGPFDLTMLECGQYNKRWKNIHMMPEETVQAHQDLGGQLLMPIHWGKFTLSLHSWKEPVERISKAAAANSVQLLTPVAGEIMVIPSRTVDSDWWEQYK